MLDTYVSSCVNKYIGLFKAIFVIVFSEKKIEVMANEVASHGA